MLSSMACAVFFLAACSSPQPSTSLPAETLSTPPAPSPITPTDDKEVDLRLAAREGDIETIRRLLVKGVGIDAKDEQGWTALREAVFQEHTSAVNFLLDRGANPNVKDNEGNSSLHWAAQIGHDGIVAALLNAGADPNIPDAFSGSSPLYFAATGGHVGAVKQLIAKGADVNAKDKFGDSMLAEVINSYESASRAGRTKEARSLAQVIQILKVEGAR